MSTNNVFCFDVVVNAFKTLWNLKGKIEDFSDENIRSGIVKTVRIINNEFVKRIPTFSGIKVNEKDYDQLLQLIYGRIYTFTSIVYLEEIEMIKNEVEELVNNDSTESIEDHKEVFKNVKCLLGALDIFQFNETLSDLIGELQNLCRIFKEKETAPEKKLIFSLIWIKLVDLENLIITNTSEENKTNQNEEIVDKTQVEQKEQGKYQNAPGTEKCMKSYSKTITTKNPPTKDEFKKSFEQKEQNSISKKQEDKSLESNQKEIEGLKLQITELKKEKEESEKKTKELKRKSDEWSAEEFLLLQDINQLKTENTLLINKQSGLDKEDNEWKIENQKLKNDVCLIKEFEIERTKGFEKLVKEEVHEEIQEEIQEEKVEINEEIQEEIQEEKVEVQIPMSYYSTATPFVCEYKGILFSVPLTPETKDGDKFDFCIESNGNKIKLVCVVSFVSDGIFQRDGLNLIVTLNYSKEHYGIKTTDLLQIGNREPIPLEFEIKEGIIYESKEQGLISNDGSKGSLKVAIHLV